MGSEEARENSRRVGIMNNPLGAKPGDYLATLNGFGEVIVGIFTKYVNSTYTKDEDRPGYFWKLCWIENDKLLLKPSDYGEYCISAGSDLRFATPEEIAKAIAVRMLQ
jgi:hypothetical protein